MKTPALLLGLCLLALAVILPVRAQYGSGTGSYGSVGQGGGAGGGSTISPSKTVSNTTVWNTNQIYFYNAGDTNVGNSTNGTLWQLTFDVNNYPIYTNGLIAYSNLFYAPSNAWEIFSNGVFQYQGQNAAAKVYGAQISGFLYSKAKGHIGPNPAPQGQILSGSASASQPPMWNGGTNLGTLNPAVIGLSSYGWLVNGSNCLVQTPDLAFAYVPMAIVASQNSTNMAPGGLIGGCNNCFLGDADGVMLGCGSSQLFRGSGDDCMISCENSIQQNFNNSVVASVACFGITNYAVSTSLLGACEFGLWDSSCANLGRLGGTTFYDNVNVGFVSGSYQSNGTPALAVSGVWDFGNGNTVTTSDTITLGFTNQGLTINGNGSVNLANSNTLGSVSTPVAGMTLWVSNSSTLYVTWTNGLTYSLLSLPNVAVPFLVIQTNFVSGFVYSNTLFSAPILVTATATNLTTAAALMELRITGGNPAGGAYTNMVTFTSGMTNATMFGIVASGANYTFTNTMGTAGIRFGQLQPQ